jgi:hypothetical protein
MGLSEVVSIYRSRIFENFTIDILKELYAITKSRKYSDNNAKFIEMDKILKKNEIKYDALGTGTNRTAVLIDGYVFKIALDGMGIIDNDREYALSKDLYPYVIKTYESNGLISVCEYVAIIGNPVEYEQSSKAISKILSKIVSSGYLVGDVGTGDSGKKNFCNWGRRSDDTLCILDFAYIYSIDESILYCTYCDKPNAVIQYDVTYTDLICPECREITPFIAVRKRISKQEEDMFINEIKKKSPVIKGDEYKKPQQGEQVNIIIKKNGGNVIMDPYGEEQIFFENDPFNLKGDKKRDRYTNNKYAESEELVNTEFDADLYFQNDPFGYNKYAPKKHINQNNNHNQNQNQQRRNKSNIQMSPKELADYINNLDLSKPETVVVPKFKNYINPVVSNNRKAPTADTPPARKEAIKEATPEVKVTPQTPVVDSTPEPSTPYISLEEVINQSTNLKEVLEGHELSYASTEVESVVEDDTTVEVVVMLNDKEYSLEQLNALDNRNLLALVLPLNETDTENLLLYIQEYDEALKERISMLVEEILVIQNNIIKGINEEESQESIEYDDIIDSGEVYEDDVVMPTSQPSTGYDTTQREVFEPKVYPTDPYAHN